MKVSIDLKKCSGHARCYAVDPEIFQLDESGYALHSDVEIPPGEEGKAKPAVDSCPEGAVSIQ